MQNLPETPRRTRYELRSNCERLTAKEIEDDILQARGNEKVSSFFKATRRKMDDSSSKLRNKRRRSDNTHDGCFTSPVSVSSSPLKDLTEVSEFGEGCSTDPVVSIPTSPFGNFEELPVEIAWMILGTISYSEMGTLSLTSKSFHGFIARYIESESFIKRVQKAGKEFADNPHHPDGSFFSERDAYAQLGTLIYKVTSIYPSYARRLSILRHFLSDIAANLGCVPAAGRLIKSFMKQHEHIAIRELKMMFVMVFQVFPDMKQELDAVMTTEDDSYRKLRSPTTRDQMALLRRDTHVRRKISDLFLFNGTYDPMDRSNGLMLSILMMIYQTDSVNLNSKLIFLLYSPLVTHEDYEIINWHALDELVIHSEEVAKRVLGPIANAIQTLVACKKLRPELPWSKNTIFNLMEEVTTYPSPWSMTTFVSLLLIQPSLIPLAISARMHRRHDEEAGDMMCTAKMLLYHWNDNLDELLPVYDSLRASLSMDQRKRLHNSVWDWHQRNLRELRDRPNNFAELQTELNSQMAVLPLLTLLIRP